MPQASTAMMALISPFPESIAAIASSQKKSFYAFLQSSRMFNFKLQPPMSDGFASSEVAPRRWHDHVCEYI
jgi:hypothetical protein